MRATHGLRLNEAHPMRRYLLAFLPTASLLAALGLGLDSWWCRQNEVSAWTRLLPRETFLGSFSTPQTKYLYGEYHGDFVLMSWGGVTESLPDTEHASEAVATTLSQAPSARKILVVGEGSLSVCNRFLKIPQIEKVTWIHPDPEYTSRVREILPPRFKKESERIELPGGDLSSFLDRSPGQYDLVVLNLPDPTTLVLNRYSTLEFQRRLKGILKPGGVVCLRFSGGANYLGDELAFLGACLETTLHEVYKKLVLKPGDDSWWIASDGELLSQSAPALRDRFAGIAGAKELYPPEGLLALYLPDRAEFQLQKYRDVADRVGKAALLNTDRKPRALLYSLLVAVHQTSASRISAANVFSRGGGWILLAAIALHTLLRGVYTHRGRGGRGVLVSGNTAGFDSLFLVFCAGLVGISLNILVLFLYQSKFGSLFLEIGLLTSLFMLGAFIAGWLTRRLLMTWPTEPGWLVPICLILHIGFVLSLDGLSGTQSKTLFSGAIGLCGFFTGVYFPIAAHRLKHAGLGDAASGATLEVLDHAGGASGSILVGLFLVPVLGSETTLYLAATLMGANVFPCFFSVRAPSPAMSLSPFEQRVRQVGYILFGVGAFFLVSSQILSSLGAESEGRRLLLAAREMTGGIQLQEESAEWVEGTPSIYYSFARAQDATPEYVFGSGQVGESKVGFAGPVHLAVDMDRKGILRGFRIVESNETPAYVRLLTEWFRSLPGKELLTPVAFKGVDGVTGATLTSVAVMRTLEASGKAFGRRVLGTSGDVGPTPSQASWIPDKRFVVLTLLLLGALILRAWPQKWVRRALLLASLVVCGWFLNAQYSTQQMMSLLSLHFPGWGFTGVFFLVVLAPVITLLVGNLYCGYLCPFGALQELLGDLRPQSISSDPPKRIWAYGRLVKYVLLFSVVIFFSLTRNSQVLSADPLLTFFGSARQTRILILGGGALVASFFFKRFWCRNLCPAGAFLALLGGVKLLKRLVPTTFPGGCDLGVKNHEELDCLCCDRCRHGKT